MFMSKMHIIAGDWANEPIMRSGKSEFPLGQLESGDASPLLHCHEQLVKSSGDSIIRTMLVQFKPHMLRTPCQFDSRSATEGTSRPKGPLHGAMGRVGRTRLHWGDALSLTRV